MNLSRNHPTAAYLALAFSVLCFGFSGILVKRADLPGTVSAFYRVLLPGLVLVPWWLGRPSQRPAPRDLRLIVAGGVIFALDLTLWNASVLLIPVATATLLSNNAPLWLGLAGVFWFRERMSRAYWLGLAMALGGMVWLVGAEASRELGLSTGNLLAVGASLSYALYLRTMQGARARVDLATVMGISTLSSIVVLFLVNLATGTALTGFSREAWMALGGLGLICQLGGTLGISYVLGHLPAAPVSVCILGTVPVTALLAMPLLGEYLNGSQIAGGAAILAGIYLVIRNPRNEQKRLAPDP